MNKHVSYKTGMLIVLAIVLVGGGIMAGVLYFVINSSPTSVFSVNANKKNNTTLESQIIGKWNYIGDTNNELVSLYSSVEFTENGGFTFSISSTEHEGVSTSINYEITGNTVTIIYPSDRTEVYENVKIVDDVLYLFGDDKPYVKDSTSVASSAVSQTSYPTNSPISTPSTLTADEKTALEGFAELTYLLFEAHALIINLASDTFHGVADTLPTTADVEKNWFRLLMIIAQFQCGQGIMFFVDITMENKP